VWLGGERGARVEGVSASRARVWGAFPGTLEHDRPRSGARNERKRQERKGRERRERKKNLDEIQVRKTNTNPNEKLLRGVQTRRKRGKHETQDRDIHSQRNK